MIPSPTLVAARTSAEFLRPDLDARGIKQNDASRRTPSGTRARISVLVTCRQRPGSANGVVLMTIEDETAVANVIVWPKILNAAADRPERALRGGYRCCAGGSGVIHVVADQLEDLTHFSRGWPNTARTLTDWLAATKCARQSKNNVKRESPAAAITVLSSHAKRRELAGDLGVSARGSAHAPARRARIN